MHLCAKNQRGYHWAGKEPRDTVPRPGIISDLLGTHELCLAQWLLVRSKHTKPVGPKKGRPETTPEAPLPSQTLTTRHTRTPENPAITPAIPSHLLRDSTVVSSVKSTTATTNEASSWSSLHVGTPSSSPNVHDRGVHEVRRAEPDSLVATTEKQRVCKKAISCHPCLLLPHPRQLLNLHLFPSLL